MCLVRKCQSLRHHLQHPLTARVHVSSPMPAAGQLPTAWQQPSRLQPLPQTFSTLLSQQPSRQQAQTVLPPSSLPTGRRRTGAAPASAQSCFVEWTLRPNLAADRRRFSSGSRPLEVHTPPGRNSSPVLTAPVSAVHTLFATVRARPGPFLPVKPASSLQVLENRLQALEAFLTGRNGPGRARTVRKQGRNSADGCGEERLLTWSGGGARGGPTVPSGAVLAM